MNKILCPFHQEKTPSCTIYPDTNSYFCFGCGATGKLSNIDKSDVRPSNFGSQMHNKTNLSKRTKEIEALPVKEIRCLEFHYDSSGYYITYPGSDYYVYRRFNPIKGIRYQYPPGHTKQMYKPLTAVKKTDTLAIVEGQINAASLAKLSDETGLPYDICSPGSATDISSKRTVLHVCNSNYRHCIVFVDFDRAGVENGLKLVKELTLEGVNCLLYPLKKDFNDLLVQDGKEELWKESTRAMEMLHMQSGRQAAVQAPGVTAAERK